MERLTIPDVQVDEHTTRRSLIDVEAVREHAMEFYWRLKAYEGTGLTPEDIKSAITASAVINLAAQALGTEPDRLRELAEADKDGRVLILPCKVGDTVYRVMTIGREAPVMLETKIKTLGQAADVAQFIGKKHKVINVFLTREEAEKALQEMEGKKDG